VPLRLCGSTFLAAARTGQIESAVNDMAGRQQKSHHEATKGTKSTKGTEFFVSFVASW
jgi:hypothetical protein